MSLKITVEVFIRKWLSMMPWLWRTIQNVPFLNFLNRLIGWRVINAAINDLRPNAALVELLGTMVGIDVFSQALTNSLLLKRVWNEETFGRFGWQLIHEKQSLEKLVAGNTPEYSGKLDVSMIYSD